MSSSRITRRLERLLERVPAELADLVGEDLAEHADLADLLGETPLGLDPDVLFGEEPRLPRIRPLLVVLAARAAGAAQVEPELQHAAELLHAALALHDLALGREDGRRRRVARRLVRTAGWLGGNQITVRALELARHAPSPEILGEVIDTLRAFSDGEALARELRRGPPPNRNDWLDHVDGHTGALYAFCCRAGGHVGGGGPAVVSALGRYGRHVGRLWNVAEDVAVLRREEGPGQLLGRAASGHPMLPVVIASETDPKIGEAWLRLGSRPRLADATELVERVTRLGGLARSREVMARESWSARRALRALPESDYRAGMDQLAAQLVRPAA